MNYFSPNFERASEDRLKMFILTATRWLNRHSVYNVPRDVMLNILDKMVRAAEVLSTGTNASPGASRMLVRGSGRPTTVPSHLEWIWELSREKDGLIRLYGAQYRRLLHALEKAYVMDTLGLGDDQDSIRNNLHVLLEASHMPGSAGGTCESRNCQWTSYNHGPDKASSHYRDCPLLEKRRDRGQKLWKRARLVLLVLRIRRCFFLGRVRWRRGALALFFIRRMQHPETLEESSVPNILSGAARSQAPLGPPPRNMSNVSKHSVRDPALMSY